MRKAVAFRIFFYKRVVLLLLQSLLSANSVCWWNSALNGATKNVIYRGYISPGAILVDAEPCALEVLRGAWARRVLQPPAGYQIIALGKFFLSKECSTFYLQFIS